MHHEFKCLMPSCSVIVCDKSSTAAPNQGTVAVCNGTFPAQNPKGVRVCAATVPLPTAPRHLGVTSCPPPTWRYGPRKSMLQ